MMTDMRFYCMVWHFAGNDAKWLWKNNKIMVVGSLSAYLFGGCRQVFLMLSYVNMTNLILKAKNLLSKC